ncbi:hypothetical protein J2X60_001882 [Curtobacterium sp. 320]|uniref:MAE_28990/MAE_18760 family HEPN-like nuclease n=2 Tax=unclassified Curtobacterium TaxID=257496 RepID=UPI002859DE62|nr:MAE_28990/MAE_18760 family HEPN-like nuclease [Curtobacterium sp. 320]MDR6573237.1 hypothetical protein [Curtobacterium sp. 320]
MAMDAGPLGSFAAGVAEVRTLAALTDGRTDDEAVNALCRSSVVLLVSHFEAFVGNLAEDFIDVLSTGELFAHQIPVGVREVHTLPRLQAIIESNDAEQRGALLKKLSDVTALWNPQAKPAPGTLKPATLKREVTNAHAETIDGLFHLMGQRGAVCDGDLDYSDDDNGRTKTANIRFSLRDAVKCRNDIAHGDVDRKPTPADVSRYLNFLVALAERLSRKQDDLVEPYRQLVVSEQGQAAS